MNDVDHVLAMKNLLGEGPLWVAEEQALYWIDIEGCQVFRFYPAAGQCTSFDVQVPITALAARASGGFVTATMNGLAFWDTQSQEQRFIAHPEAAKASNRFNDGAADRQGRFWAGTLNKVQFDAPDGALYRLDADLSIHTKQTGIAEANGIGWSPDDRTMYFVETMRRVIWAYDYEAATGSIGNRRVFAEIEGEGVYPDGLTVDSEGCVWNAQWGGGNVTRFDPAGKVERVIRLPVQQVTSCAFGGGNLDELYVTTAASGLSEEDRQKQPLAGDLFRVRTGVKGLPEPKFAG